jgi:tetratricopeptide (TPR) repeat protein
MTTYTHKAFLVTLLLLCSSIAFGQKVPKSITKRDEKNIRAAAEQTVGNLINLLNTVSDPGNTTSDLDDAISNAFTSDSRVRLFYQNDFEADDDLDPSISAEESMTKDIKAYLRQFRNFYIQNKALSIRYTITEISEIHIGESNLYLRVYFNQLMNGKDRRDNAFPSKMPKVAEMQVVSIGGQYQTLISHLDRQSKAGKGMNTPVVAISDAGSSGGGNDIGGKQYSEGYYRTQLLNGTRLLGENNYTEAYYSLKEAKRFNATEAEADARVRDLMAKMRGQNIEPTEHLYDGLSSKGQSLQEKFRYDLARKYYNYAKEVRPAAAKPAVASLLAISQLEAREQVMWELLNKGSYNEASKGFSNAIQKEKYNPSLHVGLARAYALMGSDNEAEDEFAAAIRTDPSYPDSYKWKAYFYKDKKDYRQAYEAFTAYQTRTEDSNDNVILADLAFCRGKIAMLQNNVPAAMEAFTEAMNYNPGNPEVLIAQAELLRTQGEKGVKQAKKLIEEALKKNDKMPEAYAVKAHILENEANKAGAAQAYEAAIKYDNDNPRWYYELGKLQMELNEKTDNSAILTFTNCMAIRNVSREDALLQTQALWKRGKCYYLQNRIDEAEADYTTFMKQAKMLSEPFNIDYANLLIKRAKYDDALFTLKKVGEKPSALLSLGILNYTRNPTNEGAYADYFTRAFRDGVSEEAVKAAPNMRMVYENCGLVKSLMKKFKYSTDL